MTEISEPNEKMRRQVEFLVYIRETEAMLDECLRGLPPASDREYQINIGLLTKVRKLYSSISSSIENADKLATDILMRSFNEAAVSLEYLLVKRKPTDRKRKYKEFVKTDAMRRRDLIKDLNADAVIDDMHAPGFRNAMVKSIQASIEDDGFKIDELPKPPPGGSWHQGKSYMSIAASLGALTATTFNMVYSGESGSVHPSWSDIKTNHIKQSDENHKLYVPNANNSTIAFFAEFGLLICTGLRVCETYMRTLIDEDRANEIAQTHATFHRRLTFNQK